ncbi:translation initiation factor IF-2-like [Elephas maximus indicus]|uniref:translation initiation factor IF-2-like n=1 Tax=Elephas maximus indicus TaxID=99487 RepID=UPI002115F928|nr:translation initiation factor IF-2-like [Elephas maximus indicus]
MGTGTGAPGRSGKGRGVGPRVPQGNADGRAPESPGSAEAVVRRPQQVSLCVATVCPGAKTTAAAAALRRTPFLRDRPFPEGRPRQLGARRAGEQASGVAPKKAPQKPQAAQWGAAQPGVRLRGRPWRSQRRPRYQPTTPAAARATPARAAARSGEPGPESPARRARRGGCVGDRALPGRPRGAPWAQDGRGSGGRARRVSILKICPGRCPAFALGENLAEFGSSPEGRCKV